MVAPVSVERMKLLGTHLEALLGSLFVWKYQNIKEVPTLYISGSLVSVSSNLMNDKSVYDNNGQITEKSRSIEEYMLYLKSKHSGANEVLKQLSAKMRLSPNREALLASGFCYVESNPVIDLTGIIARSFIEQASLDIRLRTSMDVEANTYEIEEFVIN